MLGSVNQYKQITDSVNQQYVKIRTLGGMKINLHIY